MVLYAAGLMAPVLGTSKSGPEPFKSDHADDIKGICLFFFLSSNDASERSLDHQDGG